VFDQITAGPSGPSGGNLSSPGLILDRTNNVVLSVGDSRTESALQCVLVGLGPQTALTTITTAQNLINQNLGAWLLNRTGRRLRVRGNGIYTSEGTSAPVLTIALALGGTSLVSIATAAASTTLSTNMPFSFDFEVVTITPGAAAAAELEAHGAVIANISANTPAAAAVAYVDTNYAEIANINLESVLALTVSIAASAAITSAQLRNAAIELLA
jgi:hypothetical protein